MGLLDVFSQSVEVGGYTFSPLTLADLANFTWYFKYSKLEEAKFATKDLPPDLRTEILKEEYNNCKNLKLEYSDPNSEEKILAEPSFEHPEVQRFFNTPKGLIYQLYLSIKHTSPDMTLEKMKDIATPEFVLELQEKIMSVIDEGEVKEDSLGEIGSQ